MRIIAAFLFVFILITACGDNKKSDRKVDKREKTNSDSNAGNKDNSNGGDRKKDRSYTWTKKEQNKFLKDCEVGADQHLSGEKLKDFCACMLLHSQEYYPTYIEMERKSDDGDDATILAACADYLDEDDE